MAYKHGIYVSESDTSMPTPLTGSAGPQVIFGTAPIHLTANPAAAVNKPVLCNTYEEAVAALGYSDEWDKFTLCQSMDACFRIFGVAPVIFVNVLNPSTVAHITSNAAETITPANSQATYAKAYVLLSTLVVKKDTTTLVVGTDYFAAHDEAGHVLITLISTAAKAAATLTVSSSSLKPDGVLATDIIGGTNATTGADTGLALIRQIYPKFGIAAGLILAPGWSLTATVGAALQTACEDIDGCFNCETLIDIDSSTATVYTGVEAQKATQGVDSSHAIALWPKVKVGTKIYFYSAVYGALIAYTDAKNSDVPSLSPSNKALASPNDPSVLITAAVLANGTEVILDQEQANTVNGYGVVTALNMGGFRAWGNNTAAFPETAEQKDRWIATRRFFTWWANSFIKTYFEKVDDPANYRLIESIVDSENIRGNRFVAAGYCAGAKIKFLETENPTASILAGTIKFHMYLAPYTPAENIELVLEFDPAALVAALTGGE
ncbi:MAG: phage tail protein [Firmicutes bacterium HGW-Firmicutes-16]|nr:MAG: phage tail protein [Firmicutes bacterium HGW-Firmicutes-16]